MTRCPHAYHYWSRFLDRNINPSPSIRVCHEEDQNNMKKHVPSQFWEFQDVFSEIESKHMPVHKPWDHKIDLCLNFKPKKGQVIPLSEIEHEELKKFVDTQLAKGYIHPFISEKT